MDATFVANHKEYYKGEGGDFPPSLGRGESCESMYAHGSSVHQKCFNDALTNLLFGLWKSVWIVDPLVILPSPHPRASTCPFYPWIVVSYETYLDSFFCCFHFWIRIWVFQGVWRCFNGVLIDHILRWHVIEHSSWMLPHFAYLLTKLFATKHSSPNHFEWYGDKHICHLQVFLKHHML